ncbi:hypothetical protein N7507_011204 [Penicillium longicatenatum]|nr:hypothetical protein N7507_011204 [Penicillium longicatenatum]
MVTNSANYTSDDWENNIKLAQDAHIDAFALNMAYDDPNNVDALPAAFSAADSVGFKLFFSFDYAGNDDWPRSDVINLITEYSAHSSYFLYKGQAFVSTFEGPDRAEDWPIIESEMGRDYASALAAAVSHEQSQNVEALLQAGADPGIALLHGKYGDVISIAIQNSDSRSLRLLQEAGITLGPLAIAKLCELHDQDINTLFSLREFEFGLRDIQRTELECKLATLARSRKDLFSWLLDMEVLVRKESTIELAQVDGFLLARYGTLGDNFLRSLTRALQCPETCYVDRNMELVVGLRLVELKTVARHETTQLHDILGWICLTIRSHIPGIDPSTFSHRKGNDLLLNPLVPLPRSSDSSDCWRELFENAIVAHGPGVKQNEECRGLELDCYRMIQLAAVEYPVSVGAGTVLVGYSTALVPVRETEDGTIQWHLEVASHGQQIKPSDLQAVQSEWLQTEDLNYLLSKRALLGWCSQAKLRLGTSTYDLNVTWSGAKSKPFSLELANINLQALAQSAAPAQLGIQAGASWRRVSNTIRFTPSGEYLKCLNDSRSQQIVLYDVSATRAWLVPLISVLHHMLLVYWKRIPEHFRERDVPLADTSSLHQNASYEALVDKGEMVIQNSEGSRQSLIVRNLIIGFSINLARISLQKPKARKSIFGYEFMDIVCEPQTTVLKKTTLEKDGLAWLPMLNEVNCLFCSNLGDVIVAQRTSETSSPCNTLPEGYDLLAALIRSIDDLSETKGGCHEGHARLLSHDSAWRLTGSPFEACQHDSHESCWNRPKFLQHIAPLRPAVKSCNFSLRDHANGAVVFGGQLKARWFTSSTQVSGQYQIRQDTIRVPVKQEQLENNTQMLVRSD